MPLSRGPLEDTALYVVNGGGVPRLRAFVRNDPARNEQVLPIPAPGPRSEVNLTGWLAAYRRAVICNWLPWGGRRMRMSLRGMEHDGPLIAHVWAWLTLLAEPARTTRAVVFEDDEVVTAKSWRMIECLLRREQFSWVNLNPLRPGVKNETRRATLARESSCGVVMYAHHEGRASDSGEFSSRCSFNPMRDVWNGAYIISRELVPQLLRRMDSYMARHWAQNPNWDWLLSALLCELRGAGEGLNGTQRWRFYSLETNSVTRHGLEDKRSMRYSRKLQVQSDGAFERSKDLRRVEDDHNIRSPRRGQVVLCPKPRLRLGETAARRDGVDEARD